MPAAGHTRGNTLQSQRGGRQAYIDKLHFIPVLSGFIHQDEVKM